MNDEGATPFHPLDPGRIELSDVMEVHYWCRELQCSESQLRQAVSKVGEHVAAVREQLKSR
ncbi:MAG: DUF3606 domain-containing protein [Burkholderiaceae bacterium]